ncbi:RICIN domain-containing protein [Streptomyces olivoreticuli]
MTPNASYAATGLTLQNGSSGKCLEVDGSSASNGARVQQWDCNGQSGSYWGTQSAGGGYVRIINNSGKCLEIADSRTDDGAPAQQWTCSSGYDTQLWKLEVKGGDFGNRFVNKNSGKVLEIDNGSRSNGARAQQWSSAWASQQYWRVLLNT